MHPNATLIDQFYRAFAAGDAATMAAAYASNAHFSDPVFQNLHGDEPGAMWRMLVSRASDLVVVHSKVEADDRSGSAHWDATYTFGATGRQVHNQIDARFEFDGGKITRHVDTFDLWKWTRMALGVPGVLLGWSPLVQNKVRTQANAQLKRYMEKHPA